MSVQRLITRMRNMADNPCAKPPFGAHKKPEKTLLACCEFVIIGEVTRT